MIVGTRASARARLVMLLAAAALLAGAIAATRASSAGPSAGQLYAFGNNSFGQLGEVTPMADPSPVFIGIPGSAGPVLQASAGEDHTLAVGSDGSLFALGNNHYGQLGTDDGTTGSDTPHANPLKVTLTGAGGRVVQASGGHFFSLALTSSGEVWAFGDDIYGQLGPGSSTSPGSDTANPTPTQITGFPTGVGPIIDVAAGRYHALAIDNRDQLYAWGQNGEGQLGIGTNAGTVNANPTPALVSAAHTGSYTQVAAGVFHSLALTSTGVVLSFGYDFHGQLGRDIGAAQFTASPGPVGFPAGAGQIVAIAAGNFHSLALTSTGQVYAWGDNFYGQLGNTTNNNTDKPNLAPTPVTLPAGAGRAIQIAAGAWASYVLTSSGQLFAFGDNAQGQLGNTTNNATGNPNPTPAAVNAPGGVNLDAVATGSNASHALITIAALSVTTTALPGGCIKCVYSAQAMATGGAPPYSWTASGLPPGLTMSSSGTITGTPTQPGSGFTPTLTVTDSRGVSAATTASIIIGVPPSPTPTSTTTTTSTGPPPPGHATLHIARIATAGPHATLTLRCSGSSGQRCTGKIAATTAASKRKTKRLRVATGSFSIAAGKTARVGLSLNRAGRRLLNRLYAIPARLSIISGAAGLTRTVRFRLTIIDAPIDYFWLFDGPSTIDSNLTATKLRGSWHVTLTCHGGGCPLKRATVPIRKGVAAATPLLKGAHLRVGTVVQLTISARNAVAEVLRFTMRSGQVPLTAALCQTPGQRAPGPCHHG